MFQINNIWIGRPPFYRLPIKLANGASKGKTNTPMENLEADAYRLQLLDLRRLFLHRRGLD